MAVYPVITAGTRITSALLTSMLPLRVVKATSENVISSTTLQDDDELFLSLEGSASYDVELWLLHASPTAGDITVGWTVPSGATFSWGVIGPDPGATSSFTVTDVRMHTRNTAETADFGGGAGTGTTTYIRGTITTTNSGTLQFQWAQRVSTATNTTVRAGSILLARRYA